jgi:membrane associated rhomboid family serine protease
MFQTQRMKLIHSIRLPVYFLLIIWAVQCFQWLFHQELGLYGILPRQVDGLKGIVLAPLVHADFAHLTSNSIPLFVLSVIILFFYRKVAVPSFLMLYLLTGLAVWIFARGNTYHIGASGVVYGLVSFVFWMGIFRRSVKAIILALIVTVLYSGMFLGVLPNQEGISWESHLLGGLVGIFAAYWFKDDLESDDEKPTYDWENEPKSLEQPFFLNRDVFERKKSERQNKDHSNWFSNHS